MKCELFGFLGQLLLRYLPAYCPRTHRGCLLPRSKHHHLYFEIGLLWKSALLDKNFRTKMKTSLHTCFFGDIFLILPLLNHNWWISSLTFMLRRPQWEHFFFSVPHTFMIPRLSFFDSQTFILFIIALNSISYILLLMILVIITYDSTLCQSFYMHYF